MLLQRKKIRQLLYYRILKKEFASRSLMKPRINTFRWFDTFNHFDECKWTEFTAVTTLLLHGNWYCKWMYFWYKHESNIGQLLVFFWHLNHVVRMKSKVQACVLPQTSWDIWAGGRGRMDSQGYEWTGSFHCSIVWTTLQVQRTSWNPQMHNPPALFCWGDV